MAEPLRKAQSKLSCVINKLHPNTDKLNLFGQIKLLHGCTEVFHEIKIKQAWQKYTSNSVPSFSSCIDTVSTNLFDKKKVYVKSR